MATTLDPSGAQDRGKLISTSSKGVNTSEIQRPMDGPENSISQGVGSWD